MCAPTELSETLKQQRELAAFYEGRVRDLGIPITQTWQIMPLLFSVLALFTAGKAFNSGQFAPALLLAVAVGLGMAAFVRAIHERKALKVREEYEQEHRLLFGAPPRIELIGFALPTRRLQTKHRRP